MSRCAVCGLVDPQEPCFHNIVDSAVLSDPQLLAIQSKAAEAIDWLYWLNQGENPKAPICSFEKMKQAIGWFENQDRQPVSDSPLHSQLPAVAREIASVQADQFPPFVARRSRSGWNG